LSGTDAAARKIKAAAESTSVDRKKVDALGNLERSDLCRGLVRRVLGE